MAKVMVVDDEKDVVYLIKVLMERERFEVLEAFEATMAWKRGGDFGLEEALRARTLNHLVLADGLVEGRQAGVFGLAGFDDQTLDAMLGRCIQAGLERIRGEER